MKTEKDFFESITRKAVPMPTFRCPIVLIAGLAVLVPSLVGPVPAAGQNTDAPPPPQTRAILVGEIGGAIGPVTKDYVHRVLRHAQNTDAECVVFTMDTPGGLDASMRSIIKDILSSTVPVVIFVHPPGARAASAGAIISLSAHVAAMSPSTNMGAAHPVSIGGAAMDSTMAHKVTNDAAAYARGLAKDRGRDTDWAERIVRESISSDADELIAIGVIDFIADEVDELLAMIDGFTVRVGNEPRKLATVGLARVIMAPSLRERLLSRIADPNIAYLLMLAGIFGIFFELQNPGAIFPGIIGGIAILLAFFALQLLPVNFAGLGLILLAITLFALEIKIPSAGALTIGGVVAMLIGSIMLIDSPLPFMRVSLSVIIPSVLFTALFFMFVVGIGLRAQRRQVSTGQRGMQGTVGVATTNIAAKGSVFVRGEHWNAYSTEAIAEGEKVIIVAVEGLRLRVAAQANKEVG